MNCEEANERLLAHAVGRASDVERSGLGQHLDACPQCREQLIAFRESTALLALSVDVVDPPPSLRERIMKTVYSEASRCPAWVSEPPWYRRLGARIPTARVVAGVGALGAAAAVGVGLWSHGIPHAPAAAPSASRSVTGICGLTQDPAVTCDLTFAPDGREAVLVVHGLPPDPVRVGGGTAMLEVWLIRPNGSAVQAAYLNHVPGRGESTAVLAGDLSGFSMLAATEEPPGGSLVPTGPELVRVSIGLVH